MPCVCKLLVVVRHCLFDVSVSILHCVVSNSRMERMQKEVTMHYLRYYPDNLLERLRKTTEGLGQNSCCVGWVFNHGPLSLNQENL